MPKLTITHLFILVFGFVNASPALAQWGGLLTNKKAFEKVVVDKAVEELTKPLLAEPENTDDQSYLPLQLPLHLTL